MTRKSETGELTNRQMLYIERIRGQELPPDLKEDWNRLAGDIPFRRWEWLANWWKSYSGTHELYILLARDDRGTICGIAPWYLLRTVSGGRVIEPLGSGKVSSDYVSLLCAPRDTRHVANAMADWLSDANLMANSRRNDAWDLLHLEEVVTGDEALWTLRNQLGSHGCSTHEKPGLRAWRIPLPNDWEAYIGTLSKPVRRQARRTLKKLQEAPDINYMEAVNIEMLERGFSILVDLHQRRWDEVGIEGCFADARFTRFLHDACVDFLAIGKLHLSWLEQQGRPFVINIEFDGGEASYVYQGGMDPESRSLSPGWMHMVHLFQRSIAQGKKFRDYLRGDEPYKKHWRGQPTQLVDLRIIPPHVSARLRHGVWKLGDSLKHWIKVRLRREAAAPIEPAADEAEATENS